MRILHVVTWDAPGNPFGGPLTVANNIAEQLVVDGHDVTLVAGSPRLRRAPRTTPAGVKKMGFPALRLAPRHGFVGVLSPSLLVWVLRHLRSFDVVHVHLGRDLLSLPAALMASLSRVAIVVQTHGMIQRRQSRLVKLVDFIATRPVLRRACAVIAFTDKECRELALLSKVDPDNIAVIPNGVPPPSVNRAARRTKPQVVFCGRLNHRKRPLAYIAAAERVLAAGIEAEFLLLGADGGLQAEVVRRIEHSGLSSIRYAGSVGPDQVAEYLAESALLVLPAVDEPFGMVVLEALTVGTPVVITESCGLADFVRRHEVGFVVPDDDEARLVQAISMMIGNPSKSQAMGMLGSKVAAEAFGQASINNQIVKLYARCCKKS